jgi:hypothetical protein
MKKFYLLIIVAILRIDISAQNSEWAKVEGKYAYDYGYGIANDMAGNVYIAGKYEQDANFSNVVLPNQGNHDIYLAQYSPNGTMNWIRTGGGFNGDYAHAVTCNKTSHVYIAGEVEDGNATIVFPGSTITLNPEGNNDVFIAAYDLSGNLEWAITDGYIHNEKALGITYDNSGDLFICGYFVDTTRFGGGGLIPSKGVEDMFVAKYDSQGNFLWMRHAGGPGRDEGKSLVCDASGNVYVCGMYSNGAVFGTTTYTTASTSFGNFYDGYIAKYDPNGTLVWVKNIVGDYDDLVWSITKDNAGKLYVSGEFSGAKFGTVTEWPNGKADMFVACYDQNGTYQWVTHGGGPIADRARGISCDGSIIYVTGQFGLNAAFGGNTVYAADSSDIFVAAIDNTGNFMWVKTVGGAADTFEDNGGYESGIAVCGESGIAYATGALLNGGTFGSTHIAGYTRTDVFLTKMSSVTGVNENVFDNTVQVYPNPMRGTLNIDLAQEAKNAELAIYNIFGQTILKTNIVKTNTVDLSQFKTGLYSYIFRDNQQQIKSGKLVIE